MGIETPIVATSIGGNAGEVPDDEELNTKESLFGYEEEWFSGKNLWEDSWED